MTTTSDIGRFGIVPTSILEALRGKHTAIVVYCVLASHADRGSASWRLSRRQIAEEAGLSETTIPAVLKTLRDAGAVDIIANFTEDGDRGWSTYVVHTQLPGGSSTATRGGSSTATRSYGDNYPLTDKETDQSSTDQETTPLPPADGLDVVLDEAARMVVEHRENQGFGRAGPKAVKAAREQLDSSMGRRWLSEGVEEHEIVRCLASRVIEPALQSSPTVYWHPPTYEDANPERVREILRAL